MSAPIPALRQGAVENPFVGAEAPAGEGHSANAAALPTQAYQPKHEEICMRCGNETMVWATSSLHCTYCGFHEGCCG